MGAAADAALVTALSVLPGSDEQPHQLGQWVLWLSLGLGTVLVLAFVGILELLAARVRKRQKAAAPPPPAVVTAAESAQTSRVRRPRVAPTAGSWDLSDRHQPAAWPPAVAMRPTPVSPVTGTGPRSSGGRQTDASIEPPPTFPELVVPSPVNEPDDQDVVAAGPVDPVTADVPAVDVNTATGDQSSEARPVEVRNADPPARPRSMPHVSMPRVSMPHISIPDMSVRRVSTLLRTAARPNRPGAAETVPASTGPDDVTVRLAGAPRRMMRGAATGLAASAQRSGAAARGVLGRASSVASRTRRLPSGLVPTSAVVPVLVTVRSVADPAWWSRGAPTVLIVVVAVLLGTAGACWLAFSLRHPRALRPRTRQRLLRAAGRHTVEVQAARRLLHGLTAGDDVRLLWAEFTETSGLLVPPQMRRLISAHMEPEALVRYLAARSEDQAAERPRWLVTAVPLLCCVLPAAILVVLS